MANLIPERHIDKNGKVVTRHVRAQEAASAVRSLPAPQSPSDILISKITATLPSWGSTPEQMTDSLREIEKYDHELFTDIAHSYLACGDEERAVWRATLHASLTPAPLSVEDELTYRRAIELVPLSVVLFPDAPPGFRAHRITGDGEKAEEITGSSPGESDYDNAKAWMIVREVERLHPSDFESRPDEVAFIAANLEAVTPLIPALLKRQNASAEVIKELLDAQAPAIRDGIL